MTASEAWPERTRLLLTAAVGDPGDAETAYARWRERVDLDSLGGEEIKALPLLHERVGADDDDLARRIGKVVRFTWLKSQMLVTRTLPGIEALTAAGIPVMLAKGAAVVHHTHGRIQLRPMNDLDVAVPRARAARAGRILVRRCGLQAKALPRDPRGAPILDHVHALAFTDPESHAELDLHWQVLHGSLHRRASDEFWQRAGHGELRGVPVRVLAPEDTLVQVVSHGLRWSLDNPLTWVTDAALLLRDRDVDWSLVARTSERHRVEEVVGPGLASLRDLAPSLVPARLPAALERRTSRVAWRTRDHWSDLVRRTTPPGARPGWRDAARFGVETWGVGGRADLPDLAVWWSTGRRTPLRAQDARGRQLRPGHRLDFCFDGDGAPLLGAGWWAPDNHGSWSRGRECEVTVRLHRRLAPEAEVWFDVVPLVVGPDGERRVSVHVDGRRVARWTLTGTRTQRRSIVLPVPETGRVARIRFAVGPRLAMSSGGFNTDHRPTAMALRALGVRRARR